MNDIFCKIISKEVLSEILFEDDSFVILNSLHPAAEHHFLVIPKRHIETIAEAEAGDEALIGKMVVTAKRFAVEQGCKDFKLLFNAGTYVEVPHLHLHILCGEMKNS
jgi:histidine triad (HIT) family protein